MAQRSLRGRGSASKIPNATKFIVFSGGGGGVGVV